MGVMWAIAHAAVHARAVPPYAPPMQSAHACHAKIYVAVRISRAYIHSIETRQTRRKTETKMQVELSGVYTNESGATVDLSRIPQKSAIVAVMRAMGHVFSNEFKAKFPKVNTDSMSAEELDALNKSKTEWIDRYTGMIYDGTWGEGARAPRGPTANTFESIFNKFLFAEVRKNLAKNGNTEGDEKDTFLNPKTQEYVELERWANAFLANPTKGAQRKAELEQRAQIEVDRLEALKALKSAPTADGAEAIDL